MKIKEEDVKQLEAGFLEVTDIPRMVGQRRRKVRMRVDYRDMNKASPKDDFPLPHIDILVENIAGHALFSFMDGFSGYNQSELL